MKVPVVIGADVRVDVTGVDSSLLTEIAQRHTVMNPELDKRLRLGLETRHLPKTVRLFSYTDEGGDDGKPRRVMTLPRGSVMNTIGAFSSRGYEVQVTSHARCSDAPLVPFSDIGVQLRDYQRAAVDVLLDRVQGFVALPCGSGKTVLGSAGVVVAGQSSIVLVHTEDLCAQWAAVFKGMHHIHPRVVAGGGESSRWRPLAPGEVAICMVQTLHANKGKRGPLLGSAGLVLMDECHHAPAHTFRNLFAEIPARYRWGLTATPERSDGWSDLLPMFVGPQLYRKTMEDLIAGGYLMKPKILALSSGATPPTVRGRNHQKAATMALNWVCDDTQRTSLILSVVAAGVTAGRVALVLVPRVKLAKKIAEGLRATGIDAKSVTSRASKGERRRVLHEMRRGRLSVLVATQLADEGLDIPTIDLLVNASGGRTSGRAIQRVGRAMRIAEGKPTPIVVEVVDGGGMFRSQWKARSLAYYQQLNCQSSTLMGRDEFFEVFQKELGSGPYSF